MFVKDIFLFLFPVTNFFPLFSHKFWLVWEEN